MEGERETVSRRGREGGRDGRTEGEGGSEGRKKERKDGRLEGIVQLSRVNKEKRESEE